MAGEQVSLQFGSTAGATFAFYFFLAISIVLGVGVYQSLVKLGAQKFPSFGKLRRGPALFVGAMLIVLVFGSVYFSMLYGFYELRISDQKIYLTYILPRHTLVLQKSELSEALRSPAYRGQWHLTLYTRSGMAYRSVASSYGSVLEGAEHIQKFLEK